MRDTLSQGKGPLDCLLENIKLPGQLLDLCMT